MEEIREINVYNLIVLDESGSMYSIARQAVDGINETLNGIRKTQQEEPYQRQYVSIVTFEGNGVKGVKTIRDRVPIENVKNLGDGDYCPGGCTPLYDAMGLSLTHLQNCVRNDDVVLVTIITDGYENACGQTQEKGMDLRVHRSQSGRSRSRQRSEYRQCPQLRCNSGRHRLHEFKLRRGPAGFFPSGEEYGEIPQKGECQGILQEIKRGRCGFNRALLLYDFPVTSLIRTDIFN